MYLNTSGNPGVGPSIRNHEFDAYNRTGSAVAVGDVLMLDHLAADAASYVKATYDGTPTKAFADGTVNVDGGTGGSNGATWPWGNCLTPTAAGIGLVSGSTTAGTGGAGAPLVVVTSIYSGAGANDTKIKVCIDGVVGVKCLTTEPNVFGDSLYPVTGQTYVASTAPTAGFRCLGKPLGARADDSTGLLLAYICGSNMMSQTFVG